MSKDPLLPDRANLEEIIGYTADVQALEAAAMLVPGVDFVPIPGETPASKLRLQARAGAAGMLAVASPTSLMPRVDIAESKATTHVFVNPNLPTDSPESARNALGAAAAGRYKGSHRAPDNSPHKPRHRRK